MRALVVSAHTPDDVHGCRRRDITVGALRRAGHDVELVDLVADGFPPVMGVEEWRAYRRLEPALDDRTRPYVDALARSQILAFVYPSPWLGVPAVLKGFLERVFVPGVAFHLDPDEGRVRPGLHHVRHLVGVTSHDASRLAVTAVGDAGRRTILRTLRLGCGPACRSTWLALYGAARAGPARHRSFETRIEAALGRPRPAWTTLRWPATARRRRLGTGPRQAARHSPMNILLVYAHPADDSFVASLRDVAVGALMAGGHDLDVADLYGQGFDPVGAATATAAGATASTATATATATAAGATGAGAGCVATDQAAERARLERARGLVLVHPTWWGGQPAILQGWFDQVLTDVPPAPLRQLRRLATVTTHGSPHWVNRLQGEPGRATAMRALRSRLHPRARCQWLACYGLDRIDDDARARFADRVGRTLARW